MEMSRSSSKRNSSAELAGFFFEPLQIHLQAAYLLVELAFLGLVRPASLALARRLENLLGAFEQTLLPTVNHRRMNPELTRQLLDRLPLLHRRQGDLRLERGAMTLPFPTHD